MLSRSVYNTSYKLLKSLKIRKVFAGLLLLLFLFGDTFNSDVFAAKKKKKGGNKSSRRSAGSSKRAKTSKKSGTSSRRSAGSSKSSRRSAGGKSSRRSASSSSRTSSRRSAGSSKSARRSAGSRSFRRSAAGRSSRRSVIGSGGRGVGAGVVAGVAALAVQTYGLEPCPIGSVLWQNPEEERDNVYYKSKKTACHGPANSEANDWKKDSNVTKSAWIADDEAVVLSCESGFLKTIQNKKYACVDESSFCPLNRQVVEKQGKKYINAATEEECNKPVGAKDVKLTKEQLEASGYEIKYGRAFYLHCKEGFYSKENQVECGKCKQFYTSVVGENEGSASCRPAKKCDAGFEMSEKTGECEKTAATIEREKKDACVKDKKGYDEAAKECVACQSGWEVDSNAVCQKTEGQKVKEKIAECVKDKMGYDKSTKECKVCSVSDVKDCKGCSSSSDVEPNAHGICVESDSHRKKVREENEKKEKEKAAKEARAKFCRMFVPCPAGQIGDGCGSCSSCPPGTYSYYRGSSCIPCPSGTYNNHYGKGYGCYSCSSSGYASGTGNRYCSSCPSGAWVYEGPYSRWMYLNERRYCGSGWFGWGCNLYNRGYTIGRYNYYRLKCNQHTGSLYLAYDN